MNLIMLYEHTAPPSIRVFRIGRFIDGLTKDRPLQFGRITRDGEVRDRPADGPPKFNRMALPASFSAAFANGLRPTDMTFAGIPRWKIITFTPPKIGRDFVNTCRALVTRDGQPVLLCLAGTFTLNARPWDLANILLAFFCSFRRTAVSNES